MSLLSLVLPTIGQPDSTEDPKLNTALTAIQTWANGNIDPVNNFASAYALLYGGDSGWLTPTLGNSWTALSGYVPQYRKIGNTVMLRGSFGGPGGASGTSPFTLPAGYVPNGVVAGLAWPLTCQGSTAFTVSLQVLASGVVTIWYTAGANNMALDPVRFTVD